MASFNAGLILAGISQSPPCAQDITDWKTKAISPIANPLFFENPRIASEVHPIFMQHYLPETFDFAGGSAALGREESPNGSGISAKSSVPTSVDFLLLRRGRISIKLVSRRDSDATGHLIYCRDEIVVFAQCDDGLALGDVLPAERDHQRRFERPSWPSLRRRWQVLYLPALGAMLFL